MNQFDVIRARFSPTTTATLKPEALPFIGMVANWKALWVIDHGPYEGQYAMGFIPDGVQDPTFAWVPECDLEEIGEEAVEAEEKVMRYLQAK